MMAARIPAVKRPLSTGPANCFTKKGRTAFGFAANTHGKFAVSIETSINHIEALSEGDVLVAESVIEKVTNKLGFNIIEVKRGNELVALFKGVVYRTQKEWQE